ncbi:MAG: hypothetical protein K0A89_10145 [ANME-2 cluster archaeon]|nr:hypothetical protein [ANME-2 cluster archaeon]
MSYEEPCNARSGMHVHPYRHRLFQMPVLQHTTRGYSLSSLSVSLHRVLHSLCAAPDAHVRRQDRGNRDVISECQASRFAKV